jgi:hypothetical protein
MIIAVVCAVAAIFATLTTLYIVPFCMWIVLLMRIDHAPRAPRALTVTLDGVFLDAIELRFADVRSVRAAGRSIVLDVGSRPMKIDVGWLSRGLRRLLARHLEARVRLARGPKRKRGEAAALEAFYVFDAEAVRVYKRSVVEILPRDGPWSTVHRRERIYVRHLPAARDPYRSNATTGAIELGELD